MYYIEVETHDGTIAGIHMLENYNEWGVNSKIFTMFKDKYEVDKLYKSVLESNQFSSVSIKVV